MELHVVNGPTKGHRSLGAYRVGGSCGPARGRDGAAVGVKLPSISSSPAMEVHVIGGRARGHRSLRVDRTGGSYELTREARWGGGQPRGTTNGLDYGLQEALARPATSEGPHRCGAAERGRGGARLGRGGARLRDGEDKWTKRYNYWTLGWCCGPQTPSDALTTALGCHRTVMALSIWKPWLFFFS